MGLGGDLSAADYNRTLAPAGKHPLRPRPDTWNPTAGDAIAYAQSAIRFVIQSGSPKGFLNVRIRHIIYNAHSERLTALTALIVFVLILSKAVTAT